mmetsp:Transcript_127811/g.331342  ORF Transcript_127811/g.331342 Transcript_127811/m.331342 type:complete len:216 (-) Transcript_127811:82-729(-)
MYNPIKSQKFSPVSGAFPTMRPRKCTKTCKYSPVNLRIKSTADVSSPVSSAILKRIISEGSCKRGSTSKHRRLEARRASLGASVSSSNPGETMRVFPVLAGPDSVTGNMQDATAASTAAWIAPLGAAPNGGVYIRGRVSTVMHSGRLSICGRVSTVEQERKKSRLCCCSFPGVVAGDERLPHLEVSFMGLLSALTLRFQVPWASVRVMGPIAPQA